MNSRIDLAGVVRLLDARQTVLVPSPEAATWLRDEFAERQQALGRKAWEPPDLLAWNQWLEAQWNELTLEGQETRVLLNRLQEDTLWIATAPSAGVQITASSAHALARQARSALLLAAKYGGINRLERAADSADSRAFGLWYRVFSDRCRRTDFLPRALLAEALLEHLNTHRISPPPQLHLVGFDDPLPQQKVLWDALRAAGTDLTIHTLQVNSNPSLQASSVIEGSPENELRWAVRWARHYLSGGAAADQTAVNPSAVRRVALVLPDPEGERSLLEPLLREFLAPELEPVTEDLSSTPWHFSTGTPLLRSTPVHHAVLLLRWLLGELSTESIGTLLLSPYLVHEDGLEQRARFEFNVLRKSDVLRTELTLEAFLIWAAPHNARTHRPGPPLALQRWRELHRFANRSTRASATYGEWAEHIRRLLQLAGWPGSRTLTSGEYEATEAWDSVLDLLATLDVYGRKVSLPQLLGQLIREVQQVTLRGASSAAPVQILRTSDMEGRLFDAVLVLHATDAFWPLPETAHPLLGRSLQRELGMPGADAVVAERQSHALLQTLCERTSSLLLLTADHDANGPLRVTGMADTFQLVPYPADDLLASESAPIAASTETVEDLGPLPTLPSGQISGGARVLELQARCGFSAFAALRLRAEAPEMPSLGCDPRQSGQLLHKALEVFWSRIPSQKALRSLTMEARRSAVTEAVQEAMRAFDDAPGNDHPWTEAYLQVAATRLTRLMLHWLDHELKRGDFIVMAQEQKRLIRVGPLELTVRPDRIDQVEDGFVFVDYKTSADLSTRHWLGGRPAAPQLPLYALLEEPDKVKGLAFGRVRAGREMGWISLQADETLFPKGSTTDSFADHVAAWQTELARLAEDFAQGIATVDPKSYPKTCEYCQQRLLCRLDAATLLASDETSSMNDKQSEEYNTAG